MMARKRRFPCQIITPIVFLCLFLIVLNPYTIIGKPAGIVAALFSVVALLSGTYKSSLLPNLFSFGILICISLWGAIMSYVHGIGQLNHVYSVISFILLWLTSQGIAYVLYRFGISFNKLLKILLFVIASNSLIILLQILFPSFRSLSESILVEAGNRNWQEGFRFRGFAAAGGASLSILTPMAVAISIYLIQKRVLTYTMGLVVLAVIIGATAVIGRTGFALLPIPFLMIIFTKVKLSLSGLSKVITFILISIIFFYAMKNLFPSFVMFLENTFGDGFINYSFGFLLEGRSGLEKDGTVDVMLEFLSVVPTRFPEAITGVGFYGGSDFSPWTDSGYTRMIFSVGWILGLTFYMVLLKLLTKDATKVFPLAFFLLSILLVAEIKEPLLFSGYAARLFIILMVVNQTNRYLSSTRNYSNMKQEL